LIAEARNESVAKSNAKAKQFIFSELDQRDPAGCRKLQQDQFPARSDV
jgi:hypothetical protein